MAPKKKNSDMQFQYDIGTKVKRYFSGHGWFSGQVVDRRQMEGSNILLYRILYEDNDQEELEEHDLGNYVLNDDDEKKQSSKRRSTSSKEACEEDESNPDLQNPPQQTPQSSDGPAKRRKVLSSSKRTSTTARGVTPSPVSTSTHNPTAQQSAPTRARSKRFVKKESSSEDFCSSSEGGREKVKVVLDELAATTDEADLDAKRNSTVKIADQKEIGHEKDPTMKNETAGSSNATQPLPPVENEPPPDHLICAEIDSDDEKDRPFWVEYAPTSRATCRSCDKRISYGDFRICSRPLFRGKRGFVVYRHLECQILPSEIKSVEDVGGWRRLGTRARELLAKQVENSKVLLEKENDELHADELVQTKFQGELRQAPPGLSATLLPFQQEGVSWMYNQEVNEMVKGGILAGEYRDT
jgi:hypothetical protein